MDLREVGYDDRDWINLAGLCEGGNEPPGSLKANCKKQSFQSWCQLPHKGKGVCTFEECPKANSWISSKTYLSSSEYINAIKMSCNVTAVRFVPGRTFSTTRRHPGCSETETLGHVLGFCKKGELLRNNRHHRARTAIANLLRNRGWEVHEEIHCVSEDDSRRRVDIIAINRRTQKAMVLDPTICFERDTNQALQINDDKREYHVSYEIDICAEVLNYNRAMAVINKVFKPSLVQKHTRIKAYKTLARPVLTYGCEAWTLRERDKTRIVANEMKFLRRTAGCTRLHRKRNEDVLQELEISFTLNYIYSYRTNWQQHVHCMERSHIPRHISTYCPRGKRTLGRSLKRWLETVTCH
ncbi:hypothetical protein ANN_20145 [Periplaneta americana]|uniref:Uncharacterized protein n=1 Tax=Periplaneta americana TaxID=6978 RepID=A0ABQ8SBU2_PERAM|nr:hypothetical protein ANN_20145 [Periplaneta americana]